MKLKIIVDKLRYRTNNNTSYNFNLPKPKLNTKKLKNY